MKEITIIWLSKKETRVITVSPNEIVRSFSFLASEAETVLAGQAPSIKNHGKKHYFDYIVSRLKDPREIVLFGPDNTKEEFLDYLSDNASHLFGKVVGVESSQDMPEEKIIARGRKYI